MSKKAMNCVQTKVSSNKSNTYPLSDLSSCHEVKIPALDKYSLRPKSIKKRIEVELKIKTSVKKTPKPKAKSVVLSKYRRKNANQRERTRMKVSKKTY